MLRFLESLAAVSTFLLIAVAPLTANDGPKLDAINSEQLRYLSNNPNDLEALADYISECESEVLRHSFYLQDHATARFKLQDFSLGLDHIKPTTDEAKAKVEFGRRTVVANRRMIDVSEASLESLERKFVESPNDIERLYQWRIKAFNQIRSLAYRDSKQAETAYGTAASFIGKMKESTKEETVKLHLRRSESMMNSLQSSIETGRQALGLLGKEAPVPTVECWINDTPIEFAKLKGQVVLLDFFQLSPLRRSSVPDVRTWHKDHSPDGLHVIGLTSYGFGRWDAAKQRFVPGTRENPLTATDQRQAATKLAEIHQITYPLAIRGIRRAPFDFGFESGIVVIDRRGVVRMVRIPESQRDTNEIGDLVAALLKEN